MVAQRLPWYTVEQYFDVERFSEVKHEYLNGEIFAMAGATKEHVRIADDTKKAIDGQIDRAGTCESFGTDMRVRTAPDGLYTYPDLSVACGEAQFDAETLTNPVLIVEVLSASTEAYDRTTKFDQYKQMESLREYVLIAQDKPQIEDFLRGPGGAWKHTVAAGLDSEIRLESIGCTLKLADVYRRVRFPQNKEEV